MHLPRLRIVHEGPRKKVDHTCPKHSAKTLTCSSSRGVDNTDYFSGVIFKAGFRIDVWGKANSGRNENRMEDVFIVYYKAYSIIAEKAEKESDTDEKRTSVSETNRSKVGMSLGIVGDYGNTYPPGCRGDYGATQAPSKEALDKVCAAPVDADVDSGSERLVLTKASVVRWTAGVAAANGESRDQDGDLSK
ncbi:hypothetical protein DPMN_011584 [Dreissena polymorpha]|uniref:Uncharacterized protein n=1 Tax=Dreissena polymorpha TaxID=45954 RepID=A0A9D4S2M8_DREPO|nr:hypothetical protein DPMN_011584 [Dreissena polymorpha]